MWHKGRAWFIGDDIDTDQIMPTRYLALRTPEDLGPHALSGNDPAWSQRIARGDILVAENGWVAPGYREESGAAYMKGAELVIAVDVGVGTGAATVWTCDLTKRYIEINADYRS